MKYDVVCIVLHEANANAPGKRIQSLGVRDENGRSSTFDVDDVIRMIGNADRFIVDVNGNQAVVNEAHLRDDPYLRTAPDIYVRNNLLRLQECGLAHAAEIVWKK